MVRLIIERPMAEIQPLSSAFGAQTPLVSSNWLSSHSMSSCHVNIYTPKALFPLPRSHPLLSTRRYLLSDCSSVFSLSVICFLYQQISSTFCVSTFVWVVMLIFEILPFFLALAAVNATPHEKRQAVTERITPTAAAPPTCSDTYSGSFGIAVKNVTSTAGKAKRQVATQASE